MEQFYFRTGSKIKATGSILEMNKFSLGTLRKLVLFSLMKNQSFIFLYAVIITHVRNYTNAIPILLKPDT